MHALQCGHLGTTHIRNAYVHDDIGEVFLSQGKGLLSRFCATIREIRDFNREKYGTNRESVTLQVFSRIGKLRAGSAVRVIGLSESGGSS